MRILLINGSPRGAGSNSLRLAEAFLSGMGEQEIHRCQVRDLDIRPCLGCFGCWNKTPGVCCLKDDMAAVLEEMLWADVIVWSFPLYFFSVPGKLKTLIDRQLPLSLPFMASDSEFGGHPSRYDMSGKRHVLISTCGFYTAQGNYDGVTAIFDHLCGEGNYTAVFSGQGELFRVKELSARTDAYLELVRQAGREFAAGGVAPETDRKLRQLLYPREVFEAMADASWGVEPTGEAADEVLTFTRQMAALYNPNSYSGRELVLEMYYTDVDKRYQIRLGEKGSQVLTEDLVACTTRIETPYTLWRSIAAGEIAGADALMQGKYRVKGDLDLMLHWNRYFGPEETSAAQSQETTAPKTDMKLLLIPWILFWAVGAVDSFYGALVTLALCACLPLLGRKNRKTVFDHLSWALVPLLAIGLLLGVPARGILPLSYLIFGLIWTGSCFCELPLTAHYSMNDYGGEEAMKNPIFLRTNRILTACWGVLYLLTPIWTWLLMGTAVASWIGAVNSVLPMAMGGFTAWFQKWYPAKVARG